MNPPIIVTTEENTHRLAQFYLMETFSNEFMKFLGKWLDHNNFKMTGSFAFCLRNLVIIT
jgi:hypothetical protein